MPKSVTSGFQLNQHRNLGTKQELTGRYHLAYSSFRKKSRLDDENSSGASIPSDDYLTFYYSDDFLIFVVCDGVSGGFGGHVASNFLGNHLIDWLQKQDFTIKKTSDLLESLTRVLHTWVPEATNAVKSAPFLIPPTDKTDKEFKERRRARGAQTTFVAGVLDYQKDTADFFWMGNTRLLLEFRNKQRSVQNEGDSWESIWSTLEGPKGSVDGRRHRYSDLSRVIVYTDGLPEIFSEEEVKAWDTVNFAGLQPVDPPDDISTLVIDILDSNWHKQSFLPVPEIADYTKTQAIFKTQVVGSWIRARRNRDGFDQIVDLEPQETSFAPRDHALRGSARYQFQLISPNELPSHYTEWIVLHGGEAPATESSDQEAESLLTPVSVTPSQRQPRKRPVRTEPPPATPPQVPETPISPIVVSGEGSILRPKRLRNIRLAFPLLGWILAIIGWGIAAYLFVSLSRLQNYVEEQQNLADDLSATITSLEVIPPTPTLKATPTSLTSGESNDTPTPAATLRITSTTETTPSTGDEFPSPTITPTQTLTTTNTVGVNAAVETTATIDATATLSVSPSSNNVQECSRFSTVSEGLVLRREPNESSEAIFDVPSDHILIKEPNSNEQWFLLYDENGPQGLPITGWTLAADVEAFALCINE